MCYLVNVAVHERHQKASEIILAHGFHVTPSTNSSVRGILSGRGHIMEITHGGCSCCFWPRQFDEVAERQRYQRKGWSAAKIERAISSKRDVKLRSSADKLAVEFCHAVEEIVSLGVQVWLLAHFYSGRFDEEVIEVCESTHMSLAQFTSGGGVFPADTVIALK